MAVHGRAEITHIHEFGTKHHKKSNDTTFPYNSDARNSLEILKL